MGSEMCIRDRPDQRHQPQEHDAHEGHHLPRLEAGRVGHQVNLLFQHGLDPTAATARGPPRGRSRGRPDLAFLQNVMLLLLLRFVIVVVFFVVVVVYEEERGVGSDISDSLNNVDDTGVFPSFFSFWTSFWLILDSI